jgi:sugar phosphate isomerase/epimerase
MPRVAPAAVSTVEIQPSPCTRRRFLQLAAGAAAALAPRHGGAAGGVTEFRLRHVLATNQYGTMPVEVILPELKATGAEALDVWAGRWGNQTEQIEALGRERFAALLAQHGARVAVYTCMDVSLARAEPRMRAVKAWGGEMVVAGFGGGGPGARDLRGDDLKRAIRATVEKLKPALAQAGEIGVKVAIENHLNGLLETPDGVSWLAETLREPHVGIALAPFHLPQDAARLGQLVGDLGSRVFYFYAWQHGDGSGELPAAAQRRQLPGVGPLDFAPMLAALKRHRFNGWTAIFMHPTPRGSPLHPTPGQVSAELNRAKAYLDRTLAGV